MEFIENGIAMLQQMDSAVLILRLILVVILAGIIGWERESWSKPAGLRTHVLVGISAVLVAFAGDKLSEQTGADCTRLPAQLLSGIGFLGAGTILRDGYNVKGLTTAASLLTVTCIGLCLGLGFYMASILATFIAYLILSYSHFISDYLEKFGNMKLVVLCENPKTIVEEVKEILVQNEVDIIKMNIHKEQKKNYLELEGKCRADIDKNLIIPNLLKIEAVDGIDEFEIEK